MDYSYFNAAPTSYNFLGLPPTPDTTNAPNSEEAYSNGSPPDAVEPVTAQHFDPFGTGFGSNGMASQDPSPGSAPKPYSNGAVQRPGQEITYEDHDQRNRSSSEEKDTMTPAKSRRKAQNRAAQRAFRERKDRYLKDVEQKLSTLEASSSTLHSDNERLKREVEKLSTENEILRATSAAATAHASSHPHAPGVAAAGAAAAPLSFSPTDFYSSVLHSYELKVPSHRITVSEVTGERLMGAGATWDYIVGHELFKKGLVDVGDACERLKKKAKCDGQGPSFEERDIREAIETSAASGTDELI